MEIHKKTILLLFLLLFIPQIIELTENNIFCQSPGNSNWIKKADAPQGCVFPHMAPQIIEDKVFLLQTKDYFVNKLLIYNIKNDSWISKATSLLTNRHHFATAVYNNKLYVAGGCIGENDSVIHVRTGSMEMYDPDTDKWVSKKSLLTPRQGFQLVVYQNKFFAIGGFDKDSIPINTIEVYDPENDTWNVKITAPWNNSLTCVGAVIFDHRIYILGESNRTSVFMVFDPNKNTFAELTPKYLDRHAYGVTLAGDKIFVVGGAQQNPVKTVAVYSINKKTWTKSPDIPETRAYPGVIQYNNKVCCIGGVSTDWNWGNPCNSVFEYEDKVKPPYASDEPILNPKRFEVPGLSDFFGITFTQDGKTFYINKFGIIKVPGTNPTAAILEYNFENGKWAKRKPLGFSMVKDAHDEAPFLSPDGKRIYFNSSRPPHRGNFNIYYAEKNDTGWSLAQQVKGKVNTLTQMEVSPAVAADGTLYFSAQLPSAGNGNFYYSKLLPNGDYDTPIKLSDSINTNYDEWGIYISPDQNLMLFMSSRPGGYGKCDIYLSIKKNSVWGKAYNLGPKVNTPDDEIFSCISPDGNYLFFSRFESNGAAIYYLDWTPLLDSIINESIGINPSSLINRNNSNIE